jgi:hypothetical protein
MIILFEVLTMLVYADDVKLLSDNIDTAARQQKIKHPHESPFFHYAVSPPFPLLTAGKNKVG